ncbi:uncharacterized protein CXQ87_003900 [Candidozyma duobushaemuli]|uniref:Cyclin N-terminal domain-containing protein n=2 Tax=Candidozyma TaxID=3303203 RepID=A0ABX8IBC7_9ASCO|nr:uncharacterized protein CXQ87_003900 [[Candida] duobushaemulonis]PVH16037.1 hypothetical protein CXQ87_003900 [[Candida] duobushaemulonis]QWU89277.1 hypothetical protein CA3LBN_003600 [[Candida] haemuloni]
MVYKRKEPGAPNPKNGADVPTVLQVSRPFFTLAELSYLHSNTIPENKKLAYNQRKHQIFQLLFQVVKIMKFPLRVLATAMNYYSRFYLFNPFEEPSDQNPENESLTELEKDPYLVAYTALFLATKHEDCIKKLRDMQSVANKLREVDQDVKVVNKSTGTSLPLIEMQRKIIMSLEFKLLQVLKFDFLNGAANVPSVDYLVTSFSKELGLDYSLTLFGWLVAFDIMSTPLCLVIPPHCIALAIVIVSLNLDPKGIISKHGEPGSTKTSEILENIDSMAQFRCPETLVNEGIVYILDYYVHQMKFSILNEYIPPVDPDTGKEQIFKFMDLKSRFNDLKVLSEQSVSAPQLLKQDMYLRKWDYSVASRGAARFIISNKRRRFDKELAVIRPQNKQQKQQQQKDQKEQKQDREDGREQPEARKEGEFWESKLKNQEVSDEKEKTTEENGEQGEIKKEEMKNEEVREENQRNVQA